jgi:quinate dehydrogenase (quinone)
MVVLGVAIALVGLALALGGIKLITLGGSAYYLLAGVGLVATGGLLAWRARVALPIYGVVFVATVIWALAEAGFAFWPPIPRLLAPAILAVVMLVFSPWLTRGQGPMLSRKAAWPGAAVLAVASLATIAAMFVPHGVIAETAPAIAAGPQGQGDWLAYGRTGAGTRFAPFTQIDRNNVGQLKVAWVSRSGEIADGKLKEDQNTPLQVGNMLYTCSPTNMIRALDVDTGKVIWRHDAKGQVPIWNRCRGVGYYDAATDTRPGIPTAAASALCRQRIISSTIDGRLLALDAATGKPCTDFGDKGLVALHGEIGKVKPGFYIPTSAPTVTRGLIVIGGWVSDNQERGEPSGVVRAFDARSGALVWAWDVGSPATTRLPAEGETYTAGTPNVWSTPAYDEKLGLIFLPTGNATPDYWGGKRRSFDDAWSSSVVALDIATGRPRWRFQTTHHDLWDYDVPAQPALYDMPDGHGGVIPTLVQVTKRGQIFMLDRRTGKPVRRVEEQLAPQGAAPGDRLSPTQPFSVEMPAIGVKTLTEADMWGATPFDQLACRIAFRSLRYDGPLTPPRPNSESLQWPGNFGGMNWGSAAINEDTGLLVVNDIRVGLRVNLVAHDFSIENSGHFVPHGEYAPQKGTPFASVVKTFMSPINVPCQAPPYGTVSGINLATGKLAWQVPAGTVRETGPLGVRTGLSIPIGMPTLGGPMLTRSGLAFHAGTQDFYLCAYDQANGRELWKGALPVGSQATPMTYVSPKTGRQYVVISAGGSRQSTKRGDYLIAFALPRTN